MVAAHGRVKVLDFGLAKLFARTDGFASGEDQATRTVVLEQPVTEEGLIVGGTIRMVTPDGIISTIAGTGALGYAGDGGPASLAILNRPYGLAVDSSGNIYFTELADSRIRKFRPGGTISTIAGGGPISGNGLMMAVRRKRITYAMCRM
jgi:hypothetical protein